MGGGGLVPTLGLSGLHFFFSFQIWHIAVDWLYFYEFKGCTVPSSNNSIYLFYMFEGGGGVGTHIRVE